MRKAVYITGTFSASVFLLSVLFKSLHLQGAKVLLFTGLILAALIFLPLASIYLYQKRKI
jgi:hypothetical protein